MRWTRKYWIISNKTRAKWGPGQRNRRTKFRSLKPGSGWVTTTLSLCRWAQTVTYYMFEGFHEPIYRSKKYSITSFICCKHFGEYYCWCVQEQLLPIVELMSTGNAHFSKLKDFITLQLPAGFPVNIEIPLYHMINARFVVFLMKLSKTRVNTTLHFFTKIFFWLPKIWSQKNFSVN